jgi:hypothetical protein
MDHDDGVCLGAERRLTDGLHTLYVQESDNVANRSAPDRSPLP